MKNEDKVVALDHTVTHSRAQYMYIYIYIYHIKSNYFFQFCSSLAATYRLRNTFHFSLNNLFVTNSTV